MTLLDIGCGWGATHEAGDGEVRRQRHRPDAVARTSTPTATSCSSTLDTDAHVRRPAARAGSSSSDPVDRIVSIEAFEHFGFERYDDFFKTLLRHPARRRPDDHPEQRQLPPVRPGRARQEADVRAGRGSSSSSSPRSSRAAGSRPRKMMVEHGEKAGFVVPEALSLRTHYIKTLRHLGRRAGSQQGRGHRGHRRRGLRPLHEVPARLPVLLRRRVLDVSLVTYLKPGAAA